jgi:hypothetical protein
MFNLEQSITKWRQEMLANGIASPVPLEELESHLREDIERQIEAGTSEETAFETTVARIGRGEQLKTEFARAGGWLNWFGNDKTTRVNRIFGVLWFLSSLHGFANISRVLVTPGLAPSSLARYVLLVGLGFLSIGILGGIRLFQGTRTGRRIIGCLAAFDLIGYTLAWVFESKFFQSSGGVFMIFCILTLWFLFSNSPKTPVAATK